MTTLTTEVQVSIYTPQVAAAFLDDVIITRDDVVFVAFHSLIEVR